MSNEALGIGYNRKLKMVVFSTFKDNQETRVEMGKLTTCRIGLTLIYMSIWGYFNDVFSNKEGQ